MRSMMFLRPGVWRAVAGHLATSSRLRSLGRPSSAVVAAAAVLVAVNATGFVQDADSGLVVMGFDPDRARLITSLLVCAGAASFAYSCSDRFVTAVLLGLLVGIALYAGTFAQETTSALASTGAGGVFDPSGWLLTLVTLLFAGVVVAWSAATLSRPVRLELVTAGEAIAHAARKRKVATRSLVSPIVVAVMAVLLVVCGPTLGDMLNYTPDSHMLAGGAPLQGLGAVPASTPTPSTVPSGESASTAPSSSPSQAPTSGHVPRASASPDPHPWLKWQPSGLGEVVAFRLPAPWYGAWTIQITVYLPPGYRTDGSRHYPVVYEPVFPFAEWDKAIGVKSELDALIDQGTIPASLVVFIVTSAGPYQDSECADSVDGQEWMARFLGETVPAYIDAHYRTITEPAARTLVGFSQGGYCAAMLALRYPEIFGNAVSFSGYFHAGYGSANAWRPFGHSQAVLNQYSPMVLAPRLPAEVRRGLYFVIDFDPAQAFYGPEATDFIAVLKQFGYPYAAAPNGARHSWAEVRLGLGPALALVGSQQALEGVFSNGSSANGGSI